MKRSGQNRRRIPSRCKNARCSQSLPTGAESGLDASHTTSSSLKFTLFIGVIAFPCPTRAQEHFETQITQVGDAQMQTIVETGFFPDRQSVVFWHDPEWSIDLLPPANKDGSFSMRIRSTEGQETLVTLPDEARQIQSVVRAPGDKAIVRMDCDSERDGFVVLDLKKGGIADDVCSSDLTIS